MLTIALSPAALDAQSEIKIDRWVDLGSEDQRMIDEDPAFTQKCLRIGLEGGVLSFDSGGRVWGYNKQNGKYYPLHTEFHRVPGQSPMLIGFRQPKKAAN
jgi:hypothetical protein